jgi:hypothetical protein
VPTTRIRFLSVSFIAAVLSSCQETALRDYEAVMALPPLRDSRGYPYVFPISDADIAGSPEWTSERDYPPLPPRKAVALAKEEVRRLAPEVADWALKDISLQRIRNEPREVWCYVVVLGRADLVSTGPPATLEVPVLMSGKAIRGTSDLGDKAFVHGVVRSRSRAIREEF